MSNRSFKCFLCEDMKKRSKLKVKLHQSGVCFKRRLTFEISSIRSHFAFGI